MILNSETNWTGTNNIYRTYLLDLGCGHRCVVWFERKLSFCEFDPLLPFLDVPAENPYHYWHAAVSTVYG